VLAHQNPLPFHLLQQAFQLNTSSLLVVLAVVGRLQAVVVLVVIGQM
jgi:hypothetical protein